MDRVALRQDLALDDDAAALLRAEVGARQEDHADGKLAGPGERAGAVDVLTEEVLRDLDVDAGAVAGLAVGIDRAAVPDRLQRRDPGRHHLAARPAVERSDQPDTAGVVLVGRIIETRRREMAGVGPPSGHEAIAVTAPITRHGAVPLGMGPPPTASGAGEDPAISAAAARRGRASLARPGSPALSRRTPASPTSRWRT